MQILHLATSIRKYKSIGDHDCKGVPRTSITSGCANTRNVRLRELERAAREARLRRLAAKRRRENEERARFRELKCSGDSSCDNVRLDGMLSGFFGIGGGFLVVPGIIAATGMPLIYAIGSSLVSVMAFGLTTAGNYALSGLVDSTLVAFFIAGGIAGGFAGRLAVQRLASEKQALSRIFAAIVAVVGAYVVWRNI